VDLRSLAAALATATMATQAHADALGMPCGCEECASERASRRKRSAS